MDREVFERGTAAAVLPYDPVQDKVLMIEQFRPGAYLADDNAWQLEPVAGLCDPGETPEMTARREAIEEAKCDVTTMVSICDYHVSPGCVNELVSLYCGKADLSSPALIAGEAAEDEETEIHVLDFARVMESLQKGEFRYALTIIALQWLAMHRDELRAAWK